MVPQLTLMAAALYPWPVLRGAVEGAVAAAQQALFTKVGPRVCALGAVVARCAGAAAAPSAARSSPGAVAATQRRAPTHC
jgi:hypothetical protein